ncbi:WbqC-like protein (plasmid) [Neorhizobium galegae bv. officinalis bv. officinalis str. HAMBI 1141]|uniref:WbqC-like protein n=2 Tax=Neorhizobium galegae TaxID=399 RepID=A0A068TIG8_NEOGA|nr:WbqC family protein [Neorhizobium galegae]CDN57300.1 WbqC-like protein [Neorhizobium galegae bv. officinalis bv. officinalis str. HAMBI 1141]
MRTAVIHQPDFAPYLGFFQRFQHADLYIVLDHVQFVHGTSKSWTHRDKIKTSEGERWLTLGIRKPKLGTPINQVELMPDSEWVEKNLALLRENYRKCPGWNEVFPIVESLYSERCDLLVDFNLHFLKAIMKMLDIQTPMVRSSSLKVDGSKNELLINLLQEVGANCYLSGTGAKDYMRPDLFQAAGIEVVWQKFTHPIYRQPFGDFMPYLSILDLLLNCGISEARDVLRSCK